MLLGTRKELAQATLLEGSEQDSDLDVERLGQSLLSGKPVTRVAHCDAFTGPVDPIQPRSHPHLSRRFVREERCNREGLLASKPSNVEQ